MGGDEGSMGESLSRFLASEFISTQGLGKMVFPGFGVVGLWLNDQLRPNFVDVAPDDNQPDATTGCGTCFLFFLHDQLGHSIEEIIAADGLTLADVYHTLTGKTDAWMAFKSLVDSHYPLDGTTYFPPLDNVFPVADLDTFAAPRELSWEINGSPNVAWLFLTVPISVPVEVTLSSDSPNVISLPASVHMDSTKSISLVVHAQAAAFVESTVNLTATYAGKQITASVSVVRPEDLIVAPLEIVPSNSADPCAQHFVEGTSQDFAVKNPNVIADHTGLTYDWSVTNANAPVGNGPTFTIPALPIPGTEVTVKLTMTNAAKIRAEGSLQFATVQQETGLPEQLRQLDCSLRRLKAINAQIPPWVPIEKGEILLNRKELAGIEKQTKRVVAAAEHVVASIKATQASRTTD
jgi:hypothetical protein